MRHPAPRSYPEQPFIGRRTAKAAENACCGFFA
jgi:hypothetical protein